MLHAAQQSRDITLRQQQEQPCNFAQGDRQLSSHFTHHSKPSANSTASRFTLALALFAPPLPVLP